MARPASAPGAAATLDVPSEGMIGEPFTFTVTFDNTGLAGETGYGPYIDLFLPIGGYDGTSLNPDATSGTNDGITFTNATYLGTGVTASYLSGGGQSTCTPNQQVTHPLTRLNFNCPGAPAGVDASFRWQFVALTLPFGSFAGGDEATGGQPPAVVTVTANLSSLADLGQELPVQARSGFRYGADPLDNPASDPAIIGSLTSDWLKPSLIRLVKDYDGPENETATGPNFPRSYTIEIDVADQQTVTNLDVTDYIPGNMRYISVISTNPAAPCTPPADPGPGGLLTCTFASVTGGTGSVDASMVFEYYIPRDDNIGVRVIDVISGNDVLSENHAGALGDWVPIDPRDTGAADNASAAGSDEPAEHILTDKSIAIQKAVANQTDSANSPGDVLMYTLTFQVSDYFAFDNITIVDILSDGQRYDPSNPPELSVDGNGFDLDAQAIHSDNLTVAANIGDDPVGPTDGTTTITFNISGELLRRHADSRLLGACLPVLGGADANCDLYDDGVDDGTTATITFYTTIQEAFSDTYPSGDPSVDQGDILTNDVTISGDVLRNEDLSPTGESEDDDSHARVIIATGNLYKTIYAVNGTVCNPQPCSSVQASPQETITYRVHYELPNSDFEDLYIDDFLPMPVFDADSVTTWAGENCAAVPGDTPPAGTACYGPVDTYHLLNSPAAIVPTLSQDSDANSLRFNYGDYDHADNHSSVIDLLFTVEILPDPFADGLFLTNQARAHEGSTNAGYKIADAIVQFQLKEPTVRILKGIVATNNSNNLFAPYPPRPGVVNITAPGSTACPRFGNGMITSANIGNTMNSNVSRVDGGDLVTFSIVVENQGRGGAYDVRIKDDLPAGFQIPASGLNLCVTDGSLAPMSYSDLGGGLLGSGIELIDPGPTNPHTAALDPGLDSNSAQVTTGRNLAVITFDLQLDGNLRAHQVLTNTATVFNVAGVEGGVDHTATDLTDPATVTLADPALAKTLAATDQAHTTGNNVVIGEIVDYTLSVRVPEANLNQARVTDTLDAGLAFLSCVEITASAGVTTDLAGGFAAACNPPINPTVTGATVAAFTLGNVTNANSDNSTQDYIYIRLRAVVLNSPTNIQNATRANTFSVTWTNTSAITVNLATGGRPIVTIVEPTLRVSKTASPLSGDAGDEITFEMTIDHATGSSINAYDVTLADSVPAQMSYVPNSLEFVSGVVPDSLSGMPLAASWSSLMPGQSSTLRFRATLDSSVSPNQTITNSATVRWTSLPGPTFAQLSPYSNLSYERTGTTTDPGGTANTYSRTGNATVQVLPPAPAKTIVTTSEDSTSGENVTIGEIVRYRVETRLPEASASDLQLLDQLPAGLTFLNDGTARMAYVCNGSPTCVASANPNIGSAPVVTGSEDDLAAITPAFTLPDEAISTDSSTDEDTYLSGTDVRFKLNDIVNTDRDSDQEFVVVEFNALVDNQSDSSNDAGDMRNNTAAVWIAGVQSGDDSPAAAITIVEPAMTVDKNVTGAPSNDVPVVTYQVVIANPIGANVTTAFNARLVDTLPATLVLDLNSVSVTFNGGAAGLTNNSTGNTLDLIVDVLPPGASASVTYAAETLGREPIENTARLTYTSLPGATGTTPNPTGSTTPGAPGSGMGERSGSGSTPNDYQAQDTAEFTVGYPLFDKLDPSPLTYTIGELVTYHLQVNLPEGTTAGLEVVDDLPAGLAYEPGSAALVTLAAQSGGHLPRDFSGSLPAFTVSATGEDGADISITFDDVALATADHDAGNNTFLVQLQARVVNSPANQLGATLTNRAELHFTNDQEHLITIAGVNQPTIDVVEPVLSIDKALVSVLPRPASLGSVATYRLTITHAAASRATAHDVQVVDVLPQGLTLNLPASFTAGGGITLLVDNSAGNTLDLTFDTLPQGQTITLTYTAALNDQLLPQTVNMADLMWSTLPGADPHERSQGSSGPDGQDMLDSGALDDYELRDNAILSVAMDLGDLPSLYRLTLTGDDGPRHILGGPRLGRSADAEYEGQENLYAEGDGADDDGVTRFGKEPWEPGGLALFNITISHAPGYLVGYFDWNRDGDFNDEDEMVIFGDMTVGTRIMAVNIPQGYHPDYSLFARFRLYPSNPGQPSPIGLATGGEVEDYYFPNESTAVTLSAFEAHPTADGVTLTWTTQLETDTAGFNLYRSEQPDTGFVAINTSLIAAKASGASQGASYTFLDASAPAGTPCYYLLETVDLDGKATVQAVILVGLPINIHLYLPAITR